MDKPSSRHANISGIFGESLILYWLSKHGFECARFDHTGIDILARNPDDARPMGISVKCRTRPKGKESDAFNFLSSDVKYLRKASEDFDCEPYVAIVADTADTIRVFITHLDDFLRLAPQKKHCYWGMRQKDLEAYIANEKVIYLTIKTYGIRWWPQTSKNT
jgi:hypothetical protein